MGDDLLAGARARAAAAAQVFVDDVASPQVDAADAHHLARVLRLEQGERVVAADGRGRWRLCAFSGPGGLADPGSLLDPVGAVCVEPPPDPPLTVAFAPAKGQRPEWVVQKLTELGLDRMVPLVTDRSVVRWHGDRARNAVRRLRRVAREAAAQSRRAWLPEVAEVATLTGLLEAADPSGVAGSSPGQLQPAHGLARAELGGPAPPADLRCVAVGPEGGWSPAERRLGLPEVGLSAHVLRAETAALAAGVLLTALRAGTVTGGVARVRSAGDVTARGERHGAG